MCTGRLRRPVWFHCKIVHGEARIVGTPSGINEQRSKNINRAAASNVAALARALCCTPDDLLEPESSYSYAVVSVD